MEISGERTFRRVEIPAGVTVRASGELRLVAETELQVDGRLVGDCVVLRLEGGAVRIRGVVRNDCAELPSGPGPALTIVASGPLTLDRAVVQTSGEGTIGRGTGPSADAGADGAPHTAQESGCAIGGRFLASPAKAAGGVDGSPWTFACTGDMAFSTFTVVAQSGGDAAPATATGAPAAATGEPGGQGGSIRIAGSGRIGFDGIAVLESGSGGAGGEAEATAADPGTGPVAAGATATGGGGGDAGAIEILATGALTVSAPLTLKVGSGGTGGDAHAQAADGSDATDDVSAQAGGRAVSIGGDGGDVPALLVQGSSVTGSQNVFGQAGSGGAGGVAVARAGDGGSGSRAFPDGAPGGELEAIGGAGGDMGVLRAPETPAAPAGGGGGILVSGGNGGGGASLCPSAADPVASVGPGGAGGAGARVEGRDGRAGDGGAGSAEPGGAVFADVGNGGDGGNGSPPGAPGPAGTNATEVAGRSEHLVANFQPGAPGGACPPVRLIQVSARIQIVSGGDPAGLDPMIFDIPAGPPNPNLQPTGSIQHPLTIVAVEDQIIVDGPAPWIRVEGQLEPNGEFRAEGEGTIAGEEGGTAVLEGLFVNGGLSSVLTMTLPGGASVRYSVISPQVLGSGLGP